MAIKRISKWGSLGERIAKLQDGESIILEPDGNPTEEAQKIRNRLHRIRACILVRRTVKVVDGKIVITRVGTWRTLGERRATRRLRMKLPMTVRWTNRSGNGEAQTESENITSRGVYFLLPTKIENGSSVELVVVLPHEITLAEPVPVRCHGVVRRTETREMGRVGVVAGIESYVFLRQDKDTDTGRPPAPQLPPP
jgi:hypothetical protein